MSTPNDGVAASAPTTVNSSTADDFPTLGQGWTVAGSTWDSAGNLRVYGLKPDGKVVEYEWTTSWNGPKEIGAQATPGSQLTAAVFTDANKNVIRRVFYHGTDGKMKVHSATNETWGAGAFSFQG